MLVMKDAQREATERMTQLRSAFVLLVCFQSTGKEKKKEKEEPPLSGIVNWACTTTF